MLLLNLVFLLFVSLLPFSTALVGRFFMHQPLVLQIYFLNQIAIGIALWSVWWACGRSRGIDERGAEHGHGFEVRVLTLVGAAVVAIGCTFIAPRATFQAFALAVILTRVAEKRLKKKVRQPPK